MFVMGYQTALIAHSYLGARTRKEGKRTSERRIEAAAGRKQKKKDRRIGHANLKMVLTIM